MRESAYKRISETRIKLASTICEQLNGKYTETSKSKLMAILANIGINNVYNIIYEYALNNPESCDAIIALSKFDRKETVEYFLKMLKNHRTFHRDLMVECLGSLKRPELVKFIKPYLADSDRQVRFQTAYALFEIGSKEAALAMCEFISDPDEWISMTILRLLCIMKDLDTIPILKEKYQADTDLRRKALMISFLSGFNSITLLGVFDDALQSRDARLRANAIEAVGNLKLPEEELKKRIVPFLNDPNNRIRANAILAMAKIAPEKVKNQIIEMVNSDDVQLRRSAAFILCMIPPNDFLSQAEKLIGDANKTVRKRIIQSLKNFPHEFISKNINKVLSDENKWIRKYAVDMVSAIPAFETAPIINLLKTERGAPNIAACLNFLASHPTEKAMNSIKLHFKDRRLPVVKALLKALVSIGGIEEVKKVAPRLEQHDPYVVQNLTETMLEAGDIEALDELIERLSKIKSQNHLDLILPSLESLVNMLVLGDNMPPELLKAFTSTSTEELMPPIPKPRFRVPPRSSNLTKQVPSDTTSTVEIDFNTELSGLYSSLGDTTLEGFGEIDMLAMSGVPASPVQKANPIPHYKAGLAAYNLGKYKKAIKEFNKSISSNENPPKNIDAYLGFIYCEYKEYDEAMKHLKAFIKTNPKSSKANFILGKCYKQKKDWRNLIDTYQLFIQGEINASPKLKKKIHQSMGIACAILGKVETAIRLLTNLSKMEPQNPEVAYYLAMALYKSKKVSEASAMIEQAAKYAPAGKNLKKQITKLAQSIKSGSEI